MKREEIERWNRISIEAVADPQTGDYFTDHLSPVALIECRHADYVLVRKPDRAKQEWGDAQRMSLKEFKEWSSYGSIPGVWVEVHRKGVPAVGADGK